MIACYHLHVEWEGERKPLFQDISFEIPKGSFVQCTGPSGSGKSVLFSLLSLRCMPEHGQLIIGGRNLSRLSRLKIPGLRRRMGTCAQRPEFLEDRTLQENLLLPFVARGRAKDAPDAVAKLLKAFELQAVADVPMHILSEQERRMVAIARACAGHPDSILIDGGVEALDESHQRRALGALRQAHAQGSTIVLWSRKPARVMGVDVIDMRLERGTLRLVERPRLTPSPEHYAPRR